jgi:hypothetical protein
VEVEVHYQAGSRDCHAICLTCATTREQSTAPSPKFIAGVPLNVTETEHVDSGVVVDGWRAGYGGVERGVEGENDVVVDEEEVWGLGGADVVGVTWWGPGWV